MNSFPLLDKVETPMIIGMIHVPALPGTPRHQRTLASLLTLVVEEANIYAEAGVDAIMIENMHDIPYVQPPIDPVVIACMTAVATAIKAKVSLPLGIQILAGANKEALAVAKAASLDFIRAEGFVFAHMGDEGFMQASAGELLRYRKYIEAEGVRVLTDIKKKHSSHAITQDLSIVETAKAAQFFLSDGVIITGSETGNAASLEEIEAVKREVDMPVFVGSGITLDNVEVYLPITDGLIIGSYFKEKGYWGNPLSQKRVHTFMRKVKNWRNRRL